MKGNKALEDDGAMAYMIIGGRSKLLKFITFLINECLKQALIPESCKYAKVNPLHKKENESQLQHLFYYLFKDFHLVIVRRLSNLLYSGNDASSSIATGRATHAGKISKKRR